MNQHGFSDAVPSLCLAFDATRLSAYMKDPCSFKWRFVDGWSEVERVPTLSFGTVWHEATAEFDRLLLLGQTRYEALQAAISLGVRLALEHELPVAGIKGDAAKRCVRTLVRSLVWWEQDLIGRDLRVESNLDGSPAIEVKFVVPLGEKAQTGEEFTLCGSFDSVVRDDDGAVWVLERKSTTSALGPDFWQRYDPNMQTYLYDFVAAQLYPTLPLRGVIVEAMQTGVEFSRVERHKIVRTPHQRDHWREVMLYWIRRAEQDALTDAWSNGVNCETSTFRSKFKEIQKRDPRVWPALLEADLEKRDIWSPLTR